MEVKVKKIINNRKVLLVIGILLVSVLSISYAFYSIGGKQDEFINFTSGCLNITITEESDAINLNRALPVTIEEGLTYEPFEFKIQNNCSTSALYQVALESLNQTDTTLPIKNVHISLEDSEGRMITSRLDLLENALISNPTAYDARKILNGELEGNATTSFKLRMWLDYDATREETAGKTYQSKVVISAKDNVTVDDEIIKIAYTEETSTLGSNNWYKSYITKVTITDSKDSNISAKYCIGESECTPNIDQALTNNSYSFSYPNGSNYLCTQGFDSLGNRSKVVCNKLIQVDNEIPSLEFKVEDSAMGTNSWFTRIKVRVEGSDTGSGIASIKTCSTTESICTPDNETKDTSALLTLSSNVNPQKVCAIATDNNGNESGVECSTTYKVDTEAPTDNSVQINSNATSTTSTSVTLTLASTGASEMCISNTTSCTDWETYATSKSYTLDSTVGTKTVYVWFRDEAGNTTSSYVSDDIVLIGVINTVPSQSGTLTYNNGNALSPSWSNYDSSKMTLGGTTSETDAGSYNATFTPKTNYQWSDGTTSAKTVAWTIGKAAGSVSTSPTSVTVAEGSTATISVTRSDNGTISASSNSTSIATVSVSGTTVTVTGVSAGSATITITVGEGTNHLATSTTVSVTVNSAGKTMKTILAGYTQTTMPSITGVDTSATTKKVYSVADDYGTSYVFRGAPTDNWVYFGDYYWRIIRMNGDGSTRMIYAGKSTTTTGTDDQLSNTSAFNSSYNDNAYVGYMYGSTGASSYANTHANNNNSTIKGVLDTWYSNLSGVASYIDGNAGFCNDRATMSGVHSGYGTLGYGTNATSYAPWGRLYSNGSWKTTQTPNLKCTNTNDLFTTSGSSRGNGKLTNPIGLITSDEIVYAGGFGGTSSSGYWLYTGQAYWIMSTSGMNTGGIAGVFYVDSNGRLYNNIVSNAYGVRPVINLKADTTFLGSGTSSDPFKVAN